MENLGSEIVMSSTHLEKYERNYDYKWDHILFC